MSVERQSGFAQVSGARLHYEVSGDGEPLVLIHAGIADNRMWDRQLDAFEGRYCVIRHDMRGFGRTVVEERVPYSHHGICATCSISSAPDRRYWWAVRWER